MLIRTHFPNGRVVGINWYITPQIGQTLTIVCSETGNKIVWVIIVEKSCDNEDVWIEFV